MFVKGIVISFMMKVKSVFMRVVGFMLLIVSVEAVLLISLSPEIPPTKVAKELIPVTSKSVPVKSITMESLSMMKELDWSWKVRLVVIWIWASETSKLVKTLGETPEISIEQLSMSPSSFSLFKVIKPIYSYVEGGIKSVNFMFVV